VRLKKVEALRYRQVIDNFRREARRDTYELREAIEWGMEHGHLSASPEDWLEFHIARASEAQRQDVTLDDQGNVIRNRIAVESEVPDPDHPTRLIQRTFWSDIVEAPDDFVHTHFRQQLARVRKDYHSVRINMDYVMGERPRLRDRLTQMLLNFSLDEEGNGDDRA
jgi:hypothetical protein